MVRLQPYAEDIAEEVHSGQPIVGAAPFVYRVLVPLAAATLFPNDLMLGFKVVRMDDADR